MVCRGQCSGVETAGTEGFSLTTTQVQAPSKHVGRDRICFKGADRGGHPHKAPQTQKFSVWEFQSTRRQKRGSMPACTNWPRSALRTPQSTRSTQTSFSSTILLSMVNNYPFGDHWTWTRSWESALNMRIAWERTVGRQDRWDTPGQPTASSSSKSSHSRLL